MIYVGIGGGGSGELLGFFSFRRVSVESKERSLSLAVYCATVSVARFAAVAVSFGLGKPTMMMAMMVGMRT